MSYAKLMSAYEGPITRLKERDRLDGDLHVGARQKNVHGMDNAPALLFDYAKSDHRQVRHVGEIVKRNTTRLLHEWNKSDSVSPLMYDGKTLVSFSIMLHDTDSVHRTGTQDALGADDAFQVEEEPEDADVGDSYITGQVGYKESQQQGTIKHGKVDYITVKKIQRAYDGVTASLNKIDADTGSKMVTEHADSQWGDYIRKCPNASELFNVLNRLPYANDRSPDILVIASLALCTPNATKWLPTLLTEHFEKSVDSEEWRRCKVQPYWRQMVDSYMKMMSPYVGTVVSSVGN
jgi:hypothetical protein